MLEYIQIVAGIIYLAVFVIMYLLLLRFVKAVESIANSFSDHIKSK